MRTRTPTSVTSNSVRISWLIASAMRLEQAERRGLHDLAGDGVDPAVVDGLLEIVVDAGGLEVQHELDVDLERLRGA